MNQDFIQQCFDNQPVVDVAGKNYCVNSLTDHTPITQPGLLKQIVKEMSQKVNPSEFDFIVGEEDRGGYLCALASYAWDKPFTLTKWNPVGLIGEVSIDFRNTYTSGNLYLNGIRNLKNKKVIIIEDIIDSGGTVVAMIDLLRKNDIEVIDVIAVAEKTDYNGVQRIKDTTGITPKCLVRFSTDENVSKVLERF